MIYDKINFNEYATLTLPSFHGIDVKMYRFLWWRVLRKWKSVNQIRNSSKIYGNFQICDQSIKGYDASEDCHIRIWLWAYINYLLLYVIVNTILVSLFSLGVSLNELNIHTVPFILTIYIIWKCVCVCICMYGNVCVYMCVHRGKKTVR